MYYLDIDVNTRLTVVRFQTIFYTEVAVLFVGLKSGISKYNSHTQESQWNSAGKVSQLRTLNESNFFESLDGKLEPDVYVFL